MPEYESLLDLTKTFYNEKECMEHLESLRWPTGIVCPICGSTRKFHRITRGYLYKCADCEKTFSVRKGTIFEASRLPLQKWFAAIWLITSNRKGINSCQLAREIGVTQKTAWLMLGRLREVAASMTNSNIPLNGTIEADEIYIGGKDKNKPANRRNNSGSGPSGKTPVFGTVERKGNINAIVISGTGKEELHSFINQIVVEGTSLYTDEYLSYNGLSKYNNKSVNHHIGNCANGTIHTIGIDSFWAILKRGH